MRYFLTLAALFWAALIAPALQAAEPDFPALTGQVVDQANILSPQTERQLSQLLAQHEQETSNQVVVVTVNSLQGYPIEDYGYRLGRAWGVGQEGLDNGVLLIVAPNERKVRIEVGYGLEGTLTDALSKNIIEALITPRFKRGDMEGGIAAGTHAILSAIEGTYKPRKTRNRSMTSSSAFDFFGVAVIFTMIFSGVVRHFIGNRVVASLVMGGIAFLIGMLLISVMVGIFAAIAVFLLMLLTGLGGGGGGSSGGYYGGGYYGGYSSGGGFGGGSFGGGFSGGGGGFGGGGASGGW